MILCILRMFASTRSMLLAGVPRVNEAIRSLGTELYLQLSYLSFGTLNSPPTLYQLINGNNWTIHPPKVELRRNNGNGYKVAPEYWYRANDYYSSNYKLLIWEHLRAKFTCVLKTNLRIYIWPRSCFCPLRCCLNLPATMPPPRSSWTSWSLWWVREAWLLGNRWFWFGFFFFGHHFSPS